MDTAQGIGSGAIDDDERRRGRRRTDVRIGGDERRMHVRAYNHWVSLLKDRAYPSIEDLDPERHRRFRPA